MITLRLACLTVGLLAILYLRCSALTLEEWQAASFTPAQLADPTISGLNADPDHDTSNNLLEYVLGGDPFVPDTTFRLRPEFVAGAFTLTYHERHGISDVRITLQSTEDLVRWVSHNTLPEIDRADFGNFDEVTLVDLAPPLTGGHFFRLIVTHNPAEPPLLAAPTLLTITTDTPTLWTFRWHDPNVSETGYAIERRQPAGEWERFVTLPADINIWTHSDASSETAIAYRVVALGENGEAASIPAVPGDSDNDGLPDSWEMPHFGNLGQTGAGDYDSDGFTNLQEYETGTNPTVDYYGGTPPVIEMVSGNDQNYIPGEFLPKPLLVRVKNAAGTPLVGAPVAFTASPEEGLLSRTKDGTAEFHPQLIVLTDSQGLAQAWLKCP